MSLEITGRLIVKMPTQQIKESFKKREFVIETTEQYPHILKVSFNLRVSLWQEKY